MKLIKREHWIYRTVLSMLHEIASKIKDTDNLIIRISPLD